MPASLSERHASGGAAPESHSSPSVRGAISPRGGSTPLAAARPSAM